MHLLSSEFPSCLHVCLYSLCLFCHSWLLPPSTFCLVAIFKVESKELNQTKWIPLSCDPETVTIPIYPSRFEFNPGYLGMWSHTKDSWNWNSWWVLSEMGLCPAGGWQPHTTSWILVSVLAHGSRAHYRQAIGSLLQSPVAEIKDWSLADAAQTIPCPFCWARTGTQAGHFNFKNPWYGITYQDLWDSIRAFNKTEQHTLHVTPAIFKFNRWCVPPWLACEKNPGPQRFPNICLIKQNNTHARELDSVKNKTC